MQTVFQCVVFLALLVGNAASLTAQDFSRLSEAEKKQVNDWMAERAKTMIRAHKLEKEINQAWSEPKYSTPEIDALRMRYRELQQTLLHTQAKLQEIVQEMPEIKEKRRQLDVEKTKIRELSKKVAEKTGEAQ